MKRMITGTKSDLPDLEKYIVEKGYRKDCRMVREERVVVASFTKR